MVKSWMVMLHSAGPGDRKWNQPVHSGPSHRQERQSPPRPCAGGACANPALLSIGLCSDSLMSAPSRRRPSGL